MNARELRTEITRLTEQMHLQLETALKRGKEGDADLAAMYARNSATTFRDLNEARAMLGRREDEERVEQASAVLEMLRGIPVNGEALGEGGRLVMTARDYLRDVMGAK